jgi:hemoglobin-like flavoprotein
MMLEMLCFGLGLVLHWKRHRRTASPGLNHYSSLAIMQEPRMNRHQIELVTSSFEQLLPNADTAAALFYGRLLELNPDLMALFNNDMRELGRKFITMLHLIVNGLTDFDALQPIIHALGRDHVGYGVRDEHYQMVETALMWSLRQTLHARFTADVENAWITLYERVADTMKTAAAPA